MLPHFYMLSLVHFLCLPALTHYDRPKAITLGVIYDLDDFQPLMRTSCIGFHNYRGPQCKTKKKHSFQPQGKRNFY